MDDRRDTERKSPGLYFGIVDRNSGNIVGTLGDITIRGLMLIGDNPFETNAIYQLKLVMPTAVMGSREIPFDGRCIWSKETAESGRFCAGFQFTDISSQNVERIELMVESRLFESSRSQIVRF
ncbi:MAG: PilZ domain-containing protein [Candidatus Zixiibacteriota bacterium]|nr:MAG: PilZ domain-containing protein [candidate division Zixibacteria bacterium]